MVLDDSRSLRGRFDEEAWVGKAWKRAGLLAEKDTGLAEFPPTCPWAIGEAIRDGWMPTP